MSIKFSSVFIVVMMLAALLMSTANGMNLDKADKAAEPQPKVKKSPGPECPCGYAVYSPLSRKVEYFLRNESCDCSPTQKCMRTHDDLSASAYIYHCRKQETNS